MNKNDPDYRHLRVIRHDTVKDTVWVQLPRDAWQPSGLCQCDQCKGRFGWYDTMAIPLTGEKHISGPDTFLVHMPEGHQFHNVDDHGRYFTDSVGLPTLKAKVEAWIDAVHASLPKAEREYVKGKLA